MTTPRNEIEKLEEGLRKFQVDKKLKSTKTIEFDLRGRLNPTRYIEDYHNKNGHLQDFSEFVEEYINKNFNEIKKIHLNESYNLPNVKTLNDEEIKLGIRARLYRTAMGIDTEHHCFLLLKEILGVKNVVRNSDLDRSGVDFIIKFDNRSYNIHVIIDNERAGKKLIGKAENKNGFGYAGQHIVLPYSLYNHTTRDLGTGFFVFTDEYLRSFLNSLRSLEDREKPYVADFNKPDNSVDLKPYSEWAKQFK